MAVEGLAAAARAYAAGEGDAGALAQALRSAANPPRAGKENGGSKALRDVALTALKASQQRLAAPSDAAAATAAAAVGGAALAALADTGTPPSQLAAWRYNLARRLVSAKAYAAARTEAWLLFQQLRDEAPPSDSTKSKEAAEAASLAVGTALTLVLCWVEGGLLADPDALEGALAAAEALPRWLSQLKPEEATKHGEAAYRYLYKAAVGLLERRAWSPAAEVCGALLAAAGSDATAQRRALAAAAKLVGHMPEEHAAAALAALAARASGGGSSSAELGAAGALDLLGLLSSAAQRASTAAAARQLQQAAMACAASGQPLLQTAALLLPALLVQLGGSSSGSARIAVAWEQPASVAVELIADGIQRLEQAAGQPLPLAEQQRQLSLLEAAALPANALRRALAAQLPGGDKADSHGDVVQTLGGPAAAETAAAALELLAGMVGVGSRLPASSSLADQGHAAAVGLVTATRLRAACVAQQAAGSCQDVCSSQAVAQLLGWDLSAYRTSSELPPGGCAIEATELAWLASALFNAGVDLSAAEHHAAAASAMRAALAATAVGLRGLLTDGTAAGREAEGRLEGRLAEFCRKCVALSSAQQQAGDAAEALGSLGLGLALLLHLGAAEPAAWRPLVQAFVRLQAELPEAAEQQAAAAAPSKRGRGAASKKAAAAAAGSGRSAAAASDVLLAGLLQQHAPHLPPGSLAAVVELELQCWAAAGSAGGGAADRASLLAQRLLRDVFPAAQQPAEHAGVLLAMHQLGLPADDGLSGEALLERAASVLSKARGGEAAALLAHVRCALALHSARQLARQALLEQQLERQRSHAAASTSAAGSREQDAAAVGQLVDGSAADAAGWHRAQQQATAAVKALSACDGSAAAGQLQASFEELAWLLGMQGSDAAAAQLHALLPAGSAAPAPSDVLAACLFPGGSGTASELQQAAEAAAAEVGRSSAASIQRAALHCAAAEAFAADGDMVSALFHAAEAHRLLAALFHGDDGSSCGGSSCGSGAVGWWRLAAAYLGSLLQLGQLFEAAGLAEEALHALREGQHLAVAVAARPLAALFGARLANIYGKQGQPAAAAQAVAIAEQQLAAAADSSSVPAAYCRAAVQLAKAQLGIDGGAGSVSKAAWLACQQAAAACEELAAAAPSSSRGHSWCTALHAAALLAAAEATRMRGDLPAALQHGASVLEAVSGCGACSVARQQRAAALLFLGQHSAPEAESDAHVAVWGLGAASSAPAAAEAAPAAKGRGRKAPAKQPAARGRKAAAASDDEPASPAASQQPPHLQQLWAALEASRGQLSAHRAAAAALAEALGRQGRLHLAAWLLHSSMGAAMRLQYQLVLLSRRQQLAQRQRRAGGGDGGLAAQQEQLDELAAALELGLDWQLVAQLAGAAKPPPAAPAPAKGRKAAAPKAAALAAADTGAALAALEQHAMQQLQAWQAALPAGTAACSIGVLPSSSGGSLLVSRLAPTSEAAADSSMEPPLLVSLPAQQLSASLSQHPIRALRMDDDNDGPAGTVSSVQSVLDEMVAVLADSGRSMRELATDTKDQQREWWRARLALEDRLAALVKHLDSSWLGPWRCLLLGDPAEGGAAGSQAGQAAAQRLCELLAAAGRPASPQQAALLEHAAAVLARHAGGGGMSPGELRQAAHQLCHAAGLACTAEQQHELEALLAATPGRAAAAATAAAATAAAADAAPPKARTVAGGKSVKFAEDVEAAPQQQQQQQVPAAEPEAAAPPAGKAASRSRRPAAARGRRAAAAAAEEEAAAEAGSSGDGGNASPVATLGSLGSGGADEAPQTVPRDGLCQVFDSLTLEEPAPSTAAGPAAAAATTARSSKHRSRLRMMQAGTPGPATARKTAATAATGPRPAREPPLTSAKTAPPPAARPSSSEAAAGAASGPVLLVLDGALQALPWESAPGLLRQRLYRMPSLACAAATARRSSASVDLGSAFYALNPSGDLAATQAAFQDWFEGMRGWEGKAGSAPTAAELAAALSSRQLFLYCGHGGGEQYISAAKLRSLERCSAALLMGCSSGRLRAQQYYEPAGAVLAYLLAGCPAAVANLWDVTDRDIDRFSQALLTAWIAGAGKGSASSASSSEGSGADMCSAVAAARGACKLPHLVGAAPVCYGIPARLVSGR